MAWVSRTTRDNNKAGIGFQSTSSDIGPGSYSCSFPTYGFSHREKPFGSTEDRPFVGGASKGVSMITPGPGSYVMNHTTTSSNHNCPSSVAFKSKTRRMDVALVNNSPGPGFYSVKPGFVKMKQKSAPSRAYSENIIDSNTVAKWVRLPTAPSIPSIEQSFGYEAGPQGQMVLHKRLNVGHSGKKTDTAGPGEYKIPSAFAKTSQYGAVDFSRSQSKRSMDLQLKEAAATPGPGYYTVLEEERQKKANKKYFRVHLSHKEPKKISPNQTKAPGPNSYNIPSSFKKKRIAEHLQCFGSSSDRFVEERYVSGPGPGAYAKEIAPKSSSIKVNDGPEVEIGFASTQNRFTQKESSKEITAAPGSYESFSMVRDLENKLASRMAPFGTTDKRFKNKIISKLPACEEPSIEKPETKEAKHESGPSSVFNSKSSRFRDKADASLPPPGNYEINLSWGKEGGKGVMNSKDRRLKSLLNDLPGPGSYDSPVRAIQSLPKNESSTFSSKASRFLNHRGNLSPGPGAYDVINPDSDFNIPTFNISIAEEMERSLHRL